MFCLGNKRVRRVEGREQRSAQSSQGIGQEGREIRGIVKGLELGTPTLGVSQSHMISCALSGMWGMTMTETGMFHSVGSSARAVSKK